jgi:hypothetical protein
VLTEVSGVTDGQLFKGALELVDWANRHVAASFFLADGAPYPTESEEPSSGRINAALLH